MALLRNGSLIVSGLNRSFGAVGAYGIRSVFPKIMINFSEGQHTISTDTEKSSVPNGYRHPGAWVMPVKGGVLSSRNEAFVTITPVATIIKGRPIAGSSLVTIYSSAIGELVAGAIGSVTITISASGDVLATLGTTGNALIHISAYSGSGVQADGYLGGDSVINFTGNLISYAIGHMVGTTAESGLSVAGIVNGVWDALAEDNNVAGSMGELLNNSGAGANPWTTEIENGLTALDAIRLIVSAVAGKLSGADSTTITIRNALVDNKNRMVVTVDEVGNRSEIVYDLSD
jgi:hypothetical protein